MRIQIFCLSLALLMFPWTAIAEESSGAETGSNSVEFFIGGTHSDEDDIELSLGIAYERRFIGKIGLGGLVEYTKSREWVLAVPLYFHASEAWKLFVAPGVETADGDSEFLVRLGTAYEFEMGGWTLAPELSFDFVDDEVKTIVGLNFGFEF